MPVFDTSVQRETARLLRAELARSGAAVPRLLHATVGKVQRRLRMTRCIGLPTHVCLEVTNQCACSCSLCPVGERRHSRELGAMPWDRFKTLVDGFSSHVRLVSLYNWGDPFLHPRIYDMISYVDGKGIGTSISTTLRDFDPADAGRLVSSGLSKLKVSLHGASEETYREYQPRKTRSDIGFEDALDRIRAIQAAKSTLGRTAPAVVIAAIVTRGNEHELPRFVELARELGVAHSLEESSLNLRFLPRDRKMKRRDVDETTLRAERHARARQWLPRDDKYVNAYYRFVRDNAGALPPGGVKLFDCDWPWERVVISWNGDVNLCCGGFSVGERVGNVFDTPLRDIWNGPSYRAARANIAGREARQAKSVQCRSCSGRLL